MRLYRKKLKLSDRLTLSWTLHQNTINSQSIQMSCNLTLHDILNLPDKPLDLWSWDWNSKKESNKSITWDYILNFPVKPLDWDWYWNSEEESRKRIIERTLIFKEELMETVHRPHRVQILLDNGIIIEQLE